MPQHRRVQIFGTRAGTAVPAPTLTLILAVAMAVLFLAPGAASGSAPDATSSAAPSVPTSGAQLSISVTPDPGYVGGSVAVDFIVHVYGPLDEGAMTLVVYPTLPAGVTASAMPATCTPVADGGCALPGQYSSPTTLTLPYTLSPAAAGSYPVVGQLLVSPVLSEAAAARPAAVAPRDLQPPVSAVLSVLQPSISILPPVASPGQVVLVEGRDFPPGSTVDLRWNPGITAAAAPPTVGATGAFTAQLLVMGGDRTGEREALASGTGFTAPDAPFLVTPDRLLPPLLGADG